MPRTARRVVLATLALLTPFTRLALLALLALLACGRSMATGGAALPRAATAPERAGDFAVAGDPTASEGATWTFRGTVDGVAYDLTGVLYRPPGPGPFPAVVLSHGARGSAAFFARGLAPTMVGWGLVCIAVNYTHAGGVPIGAPGNDDAPGASRANVLRAHMTHELLRRLGYVDMSRVAAHGHSMGAFVDVAAIAAYPADFRVASHTGGGIRPERITGGPAPSVAEARRVHVPYQMHHGQADDVVPPEYDARLDFVLARAGTPHQLWTYPGAGHTAVRWSPLMLSRVHAWYAAHGMFGADRGGRPASPP